MHCEIFDQLEIDVIKNSLKVHSAHEEKHLQKRSKFLCSMKISYSGSNISLSSPISCVSINVIEIPVSVACHIQWRRHDFFRGGDAPATYRLSRAPAGGHGAKAPRTVAKFYF